MGKIKSFWKPRKSSAAAAAPDTREQLQQLYTAACAEEGHLRFSMRKNEQRLRQLDTDRSALQARLDAVEAREVRDRALKTQREKNPEAPAAIRTDEETGLPTAPPPAEGHA